MQEGNPPVPLAEIAKQRIPPPLSPAEKIVSSLNWHQETTRGQKSLKSSAAAFHCKSTGGTYKQGREFLKEMDTILWYFAISGGKNN